MAISKEAVAAVKGPTRKSGFEPKYHLQQKKLNPQVRLFLFLHLIAHQMTSTPYAIL